LTYLEGQQCYGPDKKILFKKQFFDIEVKGQGPTKVITVCSTPLKSYDPDKLRSEEADEAEGEAEGEAEAEEKIRLKQYVSLRAKGRHN
jgi:hypothetical protein